ncbi:MAG: energy transducer TonB [Deltaproteobacteria bacterium]|nr:MAG: energy transducer TonB [Deltaproteobacteria bacterium]
MIMRLVFFFVLSLSLHAAALVYPVSFGGRSQVDTIQVKILPIEQEEGGAGGQGGSGKGKPVGPGDAKSHRSTPPAVELRFESKTTSNPEPQTLPAETVAKVSDTSMAFVSAIASSAETVGAAISGPTGNDANGSGTGLTGTGNGNGNGSGSFGAGIALTQARYRETPRPDYPESARRDGREGRVLLRVLVDDQGRSKQVEINNSSGSDALDRAAAEAIKRWRFHPARHGDKPVESWLRIPIEFRLADAKSW